MKEYGYGALMSDYVFLEDVGRKVKEWGRDIGKGKYQVTERDRMGGGKRKKSKREALQVQLETREIPLVLLPPGMERKRLNQSYYDSRSRSSPLFISFRLLSNVYVRRQKKIYLTIEFLFVKGHGTNDSIRLLTHKNDIDQTLLMILQTHAGDKLKQVAKRRAKSKVNPDDSTGAETPLEWLKELVFPDPPDQLESFAPPLCLIQSSQPRTSRKRPKSRSYHSLDPFQKLSQSLRRKEFIEFPLIEVWEKDEFAASGFAESDQHSGLYEKVVEEAGGRPRKRRKIGVMGKKRGEAVVKGLLGGYGSSGDEEDEDDDQDSPGALVGLGQYEESEGEGMQGAPDPDTVDDPEGTGSDDGAVNPTVLIKQLKSAGFTFDPVGLDDDEVDWGDDDL